MFKKIKSSPKIFLIIAFLSILIVFGAFYYYSRQLLGIKGAYWQQISQSLTGLPSIHSGADPLISQVGSLAKKLIVPVARATDPARGNGQAKVTIFEFSDFTCAYCATVQPILKQVEAVYNNQIKIIWKDFPLTNAHPEALQAARAAQCSRRQTESGDQFWAYHDLLFANQDKLTYDNYLAWAKKAGLSEKIFGDCLQSNETANELILQNIYEGNNLEISGTPTFYINDKILSGQVTFEDFKKIIDGELKK